MKSAIPGQAALLLLCLAPLIHCTETPFFGRSPGSPPSVTDSALYHQAATPHQKSQHQKARLAGGSEIDFDIPFPLSSFTDQDAFSQVHLIAAHGRARGTGVKVAIVDGGFDLAHEALSAVVIHKWDFVDNDDNVSEAADSIDQNGVNGPDEMVGHGTAVASILMTAAPEAQFALYRVADEEGDAELQNVVAAILQAINLDVDVINLSLTCLGSSELRTAVRLAVNAGVTVVAASGNSAQPDVDFPARYAETIAVAGVDSLDILDGLTNNGPAVEVLAPAKDILVALAGTQSQYGKAQGSSYATPFVSAAAAMIIQIHPEYTPEFVRAALTSATVGLTLNEGDESVGKCGKRVDLDLATQ